MTALIEPVRENAIELVGAALCATRFDDDVVDGPAGTPFVQRWVGATEFETSPLGPWRAPGVPFAAVNLADALPSPNSLARRAKRAHRVTATIQGRQSLRDPDPDPWFSRI
jgi:hypothetical protein